MQLETCQKVVRAFERTAALLGQLTSPPPRVPCQLGGISGRPGCRIYARDDVWVLELDAPSGGWLRDRDDRRKRLTFPTLVAAIGYAEHHGLDYRIELKRKQRRGNPGIAGLGVRQRRRPRLAASGGGRRAASVEKCSVRERNKWRSFNVENTLPDRNLPSR